MKQNILYFNKFSFYRLQACLYCILIILMSTYQFTLYSVSNVKEIVDNMPEEDRIALEKLFYTLFNYDHFAYTLFGDKPVSLTSDFITTPFESEPSIKTHLARRFWKRWEVWKKYEHAFPIKHYLLIEELPDNNTKTIYFINKSKFKEKVNQHLSLFKDVLGQEISADILLKKIEANPQFFSILGQDQMLLGIMLGYGEHNARLFAKRHQIRLFVNITTLPKIPLKVPNPSEGFSTLEDEFEAYFAVLRPFGDYAYSPLTIRSVNFVADPIHSETIVLAQKYKDLRGKISAIYAKGNFLEITLLQLTETD